MSSSSFLPRIILTVSAGGRKVSIDIEGMRRYNKKVRMWICVYNWEEMCIG